MEDLAEVLKDKLHCEEDVKRSLALFNEANSSNFNLSNNIETKSKISETLLDAVNPHTHSVTWSPDTISHGLTCLRILCRGQVTLPLLCSSDSLTIIATLADISNYKDKKKYEVISDQDTRVIVESVKCLCNIYLMNKHLVGGANELGIVEGLANRLFLYHKVPLLSHDLVFYDLRLLFLLTACDPTIRSLLKANHDGLNLMNSVIHAVLFNAHPQWAPCNHNVPQMLQKPLTEGFMNILCEALKILFNQTVHWSEDSRLAKEEVDAYSQLMVYLRVLLLSLPVQISQTSVKTIGHVAEVLVNQPKNLADGFLLPPDFQATTNLCTLYPDLYPSPSLESDKEGVVSGVETVLTINLDQVFEGHNMAVIVCLLNYLYLRLCGTSASYTALPPVITALRKLSKANRVIRRYLRSKILPPLGQVTGRPEEGDDLKSKLVKLMTAAGGHGAEEIVADLLFVLCKENSSRLIKYTGYGNAAGLLMSRGLLGGGVSEGAADYSSDDDDSDTEEYIQSQPKIDEMTGGLVRDEPNPLDGMTDEEKEQEARKLNDLIHRLNSHGIIKMMPLGPETTGASNNTESDTSDCD